MINLDIATMKAIIEATIINISFQSIGFEAIANELMTTIAKEAVIMLIKTIERLLLLLLCLLLQRLTILLILLLWQLLNISCKRNHRLLLLLCQWLDLILNILGLLSLG